MTAPLIINAVVIAALRDLRDRATAAPVDILAVKAALETDDGRRELHHDHMLRQTYLIDTGPWAFTVTFSIETGHPCGTVRHLSMSILREGRVPSPEAVWMIAQYFGFEGSFRACLVYPERLRDGGTAMNVIQPILGGPVH